MPQINHFREESELISFHLPVVENGFRQIMLDSSAHILTHRAERELTHARRLAAAQVIAENVVRLTDISDSLSVLHA